MVLYFLLSVVTGSLSQPGRTAFFLDAERLDFAGKLCGGLAGMPTLRQ